MKLSKLLSLLLASTLIFSTITAQSSNAKIDVLTDNSGQVGQGEVIDIIVTLTNTQGTTPIPAYKVRSQISTPASIALPLPNAQQTGLPVGWIIVSNTAGGVITICNGTDVIPVGESRTARIKIQGNVIGGPSPINGQLSFGPGTNTTCLGPGSLLGDLPADNSSSSTITVIVATPLSLLDFTGSLVNCKPTLKWATENEVNTSTFEIERAYTNTTNWTKVGDINAQGNSSVKTNYSFVDQTASSGECKYLYRLKMLDKNGDSKYSPVVSVLGNCNKTSISIYANPAKNGVLNINIVGFNDAATASIKSTNGQIVLQKRVNNGTNLLNTKGVANGIYILTVIDKSGNTKQSKVIIQN